MRPGTAKELLSVLQYIRGNLFRGFEAAAIRCIGAQLLAALRTLAAENIVHCDLKPENIVLDAPNQLAVTVSTASTRIYNCPLKHFRLTR